jgi:hypothetical protein
LELKEYLAMSGESDKRPLDPNSTIQLDALDGVQLEDADPERSSAPREQAGPPPPLPAEGEAPPRGLGKTLVHAAVFVALVAVAIAAGLSVGRCARPRPSVDQAATNAAAPPSPPSGSVSARTLTLPPIEIK